METNEVKRANKIYIKIPVVHGNVGPNISISECKFQSHQESRDEIHINYAEDVGAADLAIFLFLGRKIGFKIFFKNLLGQCWGGDLE